MKTCCPHNNLSRSARLFTVVRGVLGIAMTVILVISIPRQARAQSGDVTQTPSLDEVRSRFQEIKTQNGQLTLADFLSVYRPNDRMAIAVKDARASWNLFVDLLKPPISKEDLTDIQKANREAVLDLRVVYDFIAEGKRENGDVLNKHESREFAYSGAKILNRWDEKGDGKQKLQEDRTDSYDGSNVRTAQSRVDGVRYGSVVPYQGLAPFYSLDSNPLLLLMMADTERIFQQPGDFHDLLAFMKHPGLAVFEDRKDPDGRNCIVFGEPGLRVYFDPEKNFCITRFDRIDIAPDGPSKKSETRHMSDFQDLGNGLWLPKRIVADEYNPDGSVRLHREWTIREWHVNEGISDDYFTLTIPKGYYVADTVRNATYVMGEKNTISEILNEVIPTPPKPSAPLRWWLIGTNLAVAVGVPIFALIRRKQKMADGGMRP